MAETRIDPSGKVYRQIFEAQTHLSLSLHEMRRRRAAQMGSLSEDNLISSKTDTGSHQHPLRTRTGAEQCSEDTVRNQLFSGTKPVIRVDQDDHEEVRGLPDSVVSAKTGSDIIERLMEKKQKEHMEAVCQLQGDLTEISVGYESLLRDTGEDFFLKLSEYDEEVERLLQKTEHDGDLEALSYQDLHEIWNSVSQVSSMRRNCIQELDELFVKYEIERAKVITAVLKKYTEKLEKISYLLPSDVHRLISNEAMTINQALLANRRSLAKLHLNLMEKDFQKEDNYHLRWQTRLQDWKEIKFVASLSQFKDFINGPEIQNPKNVQDTLTLMGTKQKSFSEQRLRILEQVRNMTPPNCLKSSAAEWYSSLSSVNEQIDCLHDETMTKLREYFADTWQKCSQAVENFKNEVSTYGFTSDEIQDIVNSEMVPLIGQCQTQAEEALASMETAFKSLAKDSEFSSQSLLTFVLGTTNVWETHTAGLQRIEQQLQDNLEEVSKNYEEENQKKESQLDVMMDKLRQESTEESLKASLEQIVNFLDVIKKGYIDFYKEGIITVERYPVMVLKEIHNYSKEVSKYFNVYEIYSQNPEDLQILYPSLILGANTASQTSSINQKSPTFQSVTSQSNTPDLAQAEDNTSYFPQEIIDSQSSETFTTLKGNVYSCPVVQCDDAEKHLNVVEVEAVLFPNSLITELQRDVREKFFNHLEERNQEVLNHTVTVVDAKKEQLKSELDLRFHLHQPRAKRIEMDIHNVRAAELILHQDRVDRHCKGILQALDDFRTEFRNLQVTQCKINEDFHSKINNMEDTLYTATNSNTLNKLTASLHKSLDEHMKAFQELQRQFRQNMEIRFEGLRESNGKLMKHFKLFADGGNFTPKEIEQYRNPLEKMDKRIDLAEQALIRDIEGTEFKILGQAKEVISKFEEKLQVLKVDLIFLEEIRRILTNTQVRIKSEALKSNTQKKMINTAISNLKESLDAYNQSIPDNQVTPGDIFGLISTVAEELRKRSQYLDCYLDPSMAVPLPETPLQGAFAVAARPRSRKQEKVGSPSADPLLQPSHMGAPFMDDKAVEVVKGLLRISKPQTCPEVSESLKETISATVTEHFCYVYEIKRYCGFFSSAPVRPSSHSGSGQILGNNGNLPGSHLHRKSAESSKSQRKKRVAKPTQSDQRFQVFSSKPDDQQEILTFKGMINNILWKANDLLLHVAEDFYKKKGRGLVSRSRHIQESFELCAEDMNKRLLVYQSQAHEYHHGCVQEFCKQLKTIEEIVFEIPEALLIKLKYQHLEGLSQSLTLSRQQFKQTLQQLQQQKRKHSSQLCARLSHPACREELNSLVSAEDARQKEERKAIKNNILELQACIKKNADEFVTALATMTENLLFQLDNILTLDEIQGGSVEPKRVNITTLVRRTLLAIPETRRILERGSRVWPGVTYFETTEGSSVKQQKRETATITTSKTTMAHLKVIEVRNTLHENYKQRIVQAFENMEKSRQEQETELVNWQEHWKNQLKTVSTLNSE
ncbi:coiled-coil domain-containing protein 180 isoform X1 [Silurus meridionalis]|nr:coiled-coil domain-containing protein 180 isoform X1 [Silurus meridionalis]